MTQSVVYFDTLEELYCSMTSLDCQRYNRMSISIYMELKRWFGDESQRRIHIYHNNDHSYILHDKSLSIEYIVSCGWFDSHLMIIICFYELLYFQKQELDSHNLYHINYPPKKLLSCVVLRMLYFIHIRLHHNFPSNNHQNSWVYLLTLQQQINKHPLLQKQKETSRMGQIQNKISMFGNR